MTQEPAQSGGPAASSGTEPSDQSSSRASTCLHGNFRLGQEHRYAGPVRSTTARYGAAALPRHSPHTASASAAAPVAVQARPDASDWAVRCDGASGARASTRSRSQRSATLETLASGTDIRSGSGDGTIGGHTKQVSEVEASWENGGRLMKAVRFDEYGDIDVLKVVDVPTPVPGPGQVLVQVKAAGINPGEAKIREGMLHSRWPATFPSGQGSDLAGVVAATGAGVTGFATGDEVIGYTDNRASQAEYVVVEAQKLTAKPAGVPREVT